jgi:phosphatidylglycerophosphatase GEP4
MVQSWNWNAVKCARRVWRQPQLLRPHFVVRDIGKIDFGGLRAGGIRAIVFDKDNCLTHPYALEIAPSLTVCVYVCDLRDDPESAMQECRRHFPSEAAVILSNSAGTRDDVGYAEVVSFMRLIDGLIWGQASRVEKHLGMRVLRHDEKAQSHALDSQDAQKPAGGSRVMEQLRARMDQPDLLNHQVAMVGDRLWTDVLFGNMNEMLTILTRPLTEDGDNLMAKQVRTFRLISDCDARCADMNRGGWNATDTRFALVSTSSLAH